MSLFTNAHSVSVRHCHLSLTGSEPATAPIWTSMGMYLAAIMILMFALVSISVAAMQLRPSPTTPSRDFGDNYNPQKFVDIRPEGVDRYVAVC